MAQVKRAASAGKRSGVYAELLAAEEAKFARRGGRPILVADRDPVTGHAVRRMAITASPSPTLEKLRAGQPATVFGWQLPRHVRGDGKPGDRFTVHPDGRISGT